MDKHEIDLVQCYIGGKELKIQHAVLLMEYIRQNFGVQRTTEPLSTKQKIGY
jgi:hypothetical protein